MIELPDVVDRAQVRMLHRRHRASFAIEALDGFEIILVLKRRNLQRDFAIELLIECQIDRPHAATSEFSLDLIAAKLLGNSRRTTRNLRSKLVGLADRNRLIGSCRVDTVSRFRLL